MLEESILVSTGPKPDIIAGLAKAKEASSMDRTLLRMRNQSGSNNFTHNFDLTYSVSIINLLAVVTVWEDLKRVILCNQVPVVISENQKHSFENKIVKNRFSMTVA